MSFWLVPLRGISTFMLSARQKRRRSVRGVRNPVDVVIVSATLGGPTADTRLTRRLLAAHPGVVVVMLLECQEREEIVEAFRAGATGVFCRAQPIEVLCKCIESVHRGKIGPGMRS